MDATFRQSQDRRQARDIAHNTGAEMWVVECVAPPDEIRRRVIRRLRA